MASGLAKNPQHLRFDKETCRSSGQLPSTRSHDGVTAQVPRFARSHPMPPTSSPSERVIDVRDIEPRYRHQIIGRLFENLVPDAALQLIADHPPKPLRYQFEMRYGDRFRWTYLEEGPEVWRVRLEHVPASTDAHQ
jgi:uncharacterized protein (DUF2249 family)